MNLDEPIPSGINRAILYNKYLEVVLWQRVKDALQSSCKLIDASLLVVCRDDYGNQFLHIGLQTPNKAENRLNDVVDPQVVKAWVYPHPKRVCRNDVRIV